MQELAAGTVYVHWLRTESREADVLLARASDALDTIERERCNQVLLPEKRRELALSRIFLRTQLGRYCDEAPRSFRFVHNTHGRPEIDEPSACRRVRFNVSHTQGAIVCAFAVSSDVGIDVERLTVEPAGVGSGFFAPSEVAELEHSKRRAERFFEIWTLKEAYAKARGFGLSGPFAGAVFSIDACRIMASFSAALNDDPAKWYFEVRRPSPVHTLAVAVRITDGCTPTVRLFS